MTWFYVVAAWLTLSVPLALLVGRSFATGRTGHQARVDRAVGYCPSEQARVSRGRRCGRVHAESTSAVARRAAAVGAPRGSCL